MGIDYSHFVAGSSSPLLHPKHSSGMGRRVGCLSLGIDLPPFYGPLLCFTDPPLSPLPNRAMCGACVRVMMMMFGGWLGRRDNCGKPQCVPYDRGLRLIATIHRIAPSALLVLILDDEAAYVGSVSL